jgi:hypothetical protein
LRPFDADWGGKAEEWGNNARKRWNPDPCRSIIDQRSIGERQSHEIENGTAEILTTEQLIEVPLKSNTFVTTL